MKRVVGFLALIVAFQVAKCDIADEAVSLVEELRGIVQGAIIVAHNNIDDLAVASTTSLNNQYAATEITLDQEWTRIWADLTVIKDLASSANANINTCLQWRVDVITKLPQRCRDDLNTCLKPFTQDLDTIKTDTKYKVDIVINTVEAYDFQIRQCNGELLCLSPIITKLENAMIEIPQKIGVEVQQAQELVQKIDVPIGNCMDQAIAYMVSTGDLLVAAVASCANKIIG